MSSCAPPGGKIIAAAEISEKAVEPRGGSVILMNLATFGPHSLRARTKYARIFHRPLGENLPCTRTKYTRFFNRPLRPCAGLAGFWVSGCNLGFRIREVSIRCTLSFVYEITIKLGTTTSRILLICGFAEATHDGTMMQYAAHGFSTNSKLLKCFKTWCT